MDNLVSLAMIIKNEQDYLSRCLEGVKDFVDEIIIVDTGSTDSSKMIAAQYTDKIYDFNWCDDFAMARNFAFSKAKSKYIMWLDADDYISEENLFKLKNLRKNLIKSDVDVYMMKYEIAFDNQGNSTFTYNRERLIKNDGTFAWEGVIHEVIAPHGKIENLDIAIKHLKDNKQSDPKRNLKIYRKLLKNGKQLNAREQYYYARELFYNKYYKRAIIAFKRFLKDDSGWVENKLGALEMLYYCYNALNDNKNILKTLYKSFEYDAPRANFLCFIGDYFMKLNKFNNAIFWFKNALNCEKDYSSGAFINEEYYNIYPALQLCVCYDRLGQKRTAKDFNDYVLKINPNHKIALLNDEYFNKIKL